MKYWKRGRELTSSGRHFRMFSFLHSTSCVHQETNAQRREAPASGRLALVIPHSIHTRIVLCSRQCYSNGKFIFCHHFGQRDYERSGISNIDELLWISIAHALRIFKSLTKSIQMCLLFRRRKMKKHAIICFVPTLRPTARNPFFKEKAIMQLCLMLA